MAHMGENSDLTEISLKKGLPFYFVGNASCTCLVFSLISVKAPRRLRQRVCKMKVKCIHRLEGI